MARRDAVITAPPDEVVRDNAAGFLPREAGEGTAEGGGGGRRQRGGRRVSETVPDGGPLPRYAVRYAGEESGGSKFAIQSSDCCRL